MNDSLVFEIQLSVEEANRKIDALLERANSKSKETGEKVGDNIAKGIKEAIAGMKLDLLQGAKIDSAKLAQIKASINQALTDGKITNQQALGMMNSLPNESGKVGQRAGSQFGSQFKGALAGILATISFEAIVGQMMDTVGAYKSVLAANIQLEGSVRATNNVLGRQYEVLTDSTTSLEERAMALGLDTSKMYEEVSAGKAVNTVLESQVKALEDNIFALEQKRDLEIQAKRDAMGYGKLTEEQQTAEEQLAALRIQQQEAKLAGDAEAFLQAKSEISIIEEQQKLTDLKIAQIDTQTDKIKDLRDVEIDLLRTELSAAKNKLDIDIAPASGKIRQVKQEYLDFINAQSQEATMRGGAIQIDDAKVKSGAKNLMDKYGKYLSEADLTKAYADLIFGGVTDMDEANELLDRFVESASVGKREGIGLGEAVQNLSYAFRTGNSQIGNLSGIAENFEDIDRNGLQLLKKRYLEQGRINDANRLGLGLATEQEKMQARRLGTLRVTEDTVGGFNRMADSGALVMDEWGNSVLKFKQALGGDLLPALSDFISAATPFLEAFTDFIKNNSGSGQTLFEIAAGATALGTAFMIFGGPVALAIGAIIGAIALFKQAWDENFLGIRTEIENLGKRLEQFYKDYQPFFDYIGEGFMTGMANSFDFLKTILSVAVNIIINALNMVMDVASGVFKIFDGISKIFSGQWLDGLKLIMGGAGEIILSPFKWAANSIIDIINGLIQYFKDTIGNAPDSIPGIGELKQFSNSMKTIDKFASGGIVRGPGTGTSDSILARLSNGEGILTAETIRRIGASGLNMLNRGQGQVVNSNDVNGSYNTSYNNFGNTGAQPFLSVGLI